MHQIAKNIHHNERLIRFCLEKAYPDGIVTVERLIKDNIVNGTQLAELAVCRTNGLITIDPIGIGKDLSDDSDVKTVTVQENYKKTWLRKNNGYTGQFNISTSHRVQVKDIVNKIGALRVIAYNPFHETWKFFIIPKEIHQKLKKLTITFDKQTGDTVGIYRKYEFPTWEEMCNN